MAAKIDAKPYLSAEESRPRLSIAPYHGLRHIPDSFERTADSRHGDPTVPAPAAIDLPFLPPPALHPYPPQTLYHPVHQRTTRRQPIRRSPPLRPLIRPTRALAPPDHPNALSLRPTFPLPQRPRLPKPARHRSNRADRSRLQTLLRQHALRQPPPARLRHEAQHTHHFIKTESGASALALGRADWISEEPERGV